ncbi:hypothetical protein G9A89_003237 [Geosiphon pyriformis]|nr:hypothetical protein G9A89_003237 [Geosiphon pyriformis]
MTEQQLCSISQLIIDDIKFADGTIARDILGGGGSHAIYGMRLWFPSPESQRIAFLVHAGYDFPSIILQKLLFLNISLTLTFHTTLPSMRGLNTFTSSDHRLFTYLTPPIRTVPTDLPTNYLKARVFHFICSPIRAQEHVAGILQLRDKLLPRPLFVWEPIPDSASKENFNACIEAMKMMDIVSPNHEEAAAFLGLISSGDIGDKFLKEEILCKMADQFLSHQIGIHGSGCIIIRASHKGCLVATKEKKELFPSYWAPSGLDRKNHHVVDVTGSGNSFCGGLAAGLLKTNYDVFEAALYATVSASYTIEQVGPPRLKINELGFESWNDSDSPTIRLDKLKQRLKYSLREKLKEKFKERINGKTRQKENDLNIEESTSDSKTSPLAEEIT